MHRYLGKCALPRPMGATGLNNSKKEKNRQVAQVSGNDRSCTSGGAKDQRDALNPALRTAPGGRAQRVLLRYRQPGVPVAQAARRSGPRRASRGRKPEPVLRRRGGTSHNPACGWPCPRAVLPRGQWWRPPPIGRCLRSCRSRSSPGDGPQAPRPPPRWTKQTTPTSNGRWSVLRAGFGGRPWSAIMDQRPFRRVSHTGEYLISVKDFSTSKQTMESPPIRKTP